MKDPFLYTRKREKLTNKFWFQFLIMPFGGVVVLVTLGLLLEPLGNILVKVPVVGFAFEKLCRVVNAPCVREPDPTYLVYDVAEKLFQNASLSDTNKKWLEDKAIEYREALMRNKKNIAAWTNLGEVERRLGELELALEAHQNALKIAPNSPEVLIGLAMTHRDLHEVAKSNEALKKVLQINPNNPIALDLLYKRKFFCGKSNGVPTTIVRNLQGEFPILRWVSVALNDLDGNPENRCQEVSARLQKYYESGNLNYITTGMMNNRPVICVADRTGHGCIEVLFTLKPETNPNEVLEKMLDISSLRAGKTPELE